MRYFSEHWTNPVAKAALTSFLYVTIVPAAKLWSGNNIEIRLLSFINLTNVLWPL